MTKIGQVTTTPTLVKITPNSGSIAGSILSVYGAGFGKLSTGVSLFYGAEDLCDKVEIHHFGHFYCHTKAKEFATGAKIQLRVGSTKYDCHSSATPEECAYKQEKASSPDITKASISGTVMTVEGTGFPDAATYLAYVTYKGVTQEGVIAAGPPNSASFNFAVGIPLSEAALAPELKFLSKLSAADITAHKSAYGFKS